MTPPSHYDITIFQEWKWYSNRFLSQMVMRNTQNKLIVNISAWMTRKSCLARWRTILCWFPVFFFFFLKMPYACHHGWRHGSYISSPTEQGIWYTCLLLLKDEQIRMWQKIRGLIWTWTSIGFAFGSALARIEKRQACACIWVELHWVAVQLLPQLQLSYV